MIDSVLISNRIFQIKNLSRKKKKKKKNKNYRELEWRERKSKRTACTADAKE